MLEKNFDVSFENSGEKEGYIELTCRHNGEDEGCPFKYFFKIIFSLSEKGFKWRTKLDNMPDAFNNKNSLSILKPNKKINFTFLGENRTSLKY